MNSKQLVKVLRKEGILYNANKLDSGLIFREYVYKCANKVGREYIYPLSMPVSNNNKTMLALYLVIATLDGTTAWKKMRRI